MGTVTYEVREKVAIVTIVRPETRNAINEATAHAVAAAMDRVDADDSIRVCVVTGAGGTFCSGMDLKAFLNGESAVTESRGFAGIVGRPPQVPLIAAVEGYALAGGFEIALCCDLIVASETARFGLPEVKRNLMATAGGLLRLPRQLPPYIANELVLTGRMAEAEELAGHGLINRVVPEGRALDAALALAGQISGNGPLAVKASKRVMRESRDWTEAEMYSRQNSIAQPVLASDDAREGARAFVEKRAPLWRGR